MRFKVVLEPFHHILVEDFFGENEYDDFVSILSETDMCDSKKSPEESKSAIDFTTKQLLKENFCGTHKYKGDQIVEPFVQFIETLKLNYNHVLKESWFFNSVLPNQIQYLVSYYKDGNYYKPHHDYSIMTGLLWFHKKPKEYVGGDLYFPEYDYTIECKDNCGIIFYSKILHSVTPIQMESGNSGRYAVSYFLSSPNSPTEEEKELYSNLNSE